MRVRKKKVSSPEYEQTIGSIEECASECLKHLGTLCECVSGMVYPQTDVQPQTTLEAEPLFNFKATPLEPQ